MVHVHQHHGTMHETHLFGSVPVATTAPAEINGFMCGAAGACTMCESESVGGFTLTDHIHRDTVGGAWALYRCARDFSLSLSLLMTMAAVVLHTCRRLKAWRRKLPLKKNCRIGQRDRIGRRKANFDVLVPLLEEGVIPIVTAHGVSPHRYNTTGPVEIGVSAEKILR